MERETRFELATCSLATNCSTAELFPQLSEFNAAKPKRAPILVAAFKESRIDGVQCH